MLATVPELQRWMGRANALTGADAERAALLLETASGLFIGHADGQLIELVEGDEITLDGNGSRVLLLPQVPVVEVTSVVLDGEELVDGTDYRWSAKGILRRLTAAWPDQERVLEVTYSHGFDDIPWDVKSAVLSAAARAFTNPLGHTSERIGSYGYTTGADGAVLLRGDEITIAQRYRL